MIDDARRRLIRSAAGMLLLMLPAARASAVASRKLTIALLDVRYPDASRLFAAELERALAGSLTPMPASIVTVPRDVRGDPDRLAQVLSDRRIDVCLAFTERDVRAVSPLLGERPVIFYLTTNPAGTGLVATSRRPGGNATGFTSFSPTHRKRWEIVRESFGPIDRICVAIDAGWTDRATLVRDASLEAARTAIALEIIDVDIAADMFAQLRTRLRGRRFAVDVPHTGLTSRDPGSIIDFVNSLGVPSIWDGTHYVRWGALCSYEADPPPEIESFVEYISLFLHGTPPGLIPVRYPSSFTLAVNARTAARTGIALSGRLLRRANLVFDGAVS